MSEPFVFDPRCDACKTPYGAVPLGTAVSLRVRPLEAEGFTVRCTLRGLGLLPEVQAMYRTRLEEELDHGA